jgi:hypothetical protein
MMTAYLIYLIPLIQVLALVAIGLIFRVDRKPKGGDSC